MKGFIDTLKGFTTHCLLFQTEDRTNKALGVFVWLLFSLYLFLIYLFLTGKL